MKNIIKTIMLSALIMASVVAEQGPQNKLQTAASNVGKKAHNVFMGGFYYPGVALRYVGSGLWTTGKYVLSLPIRGLGWGIDGTFGEGTADAIGSKTKTGLGLGAAGLLTYGVYKGINGLAKYMAITDIETAFENGGKKDELDITIPLKYGSIECQQLDIFYELLSNVLKQRFERTDLMSYVFKNNYIAVTLVCNKIDALIESAINSGKNTHDIKTICAIARENSTFGLFRRFNLLNGYCHEALVLYGKLRFARALSHAYSKLTHDEIKKLVEKRVTLVLEQ